MKVVAALLIGLIAGCSPAHTRQASTCSLTPRMSYPESRAIKRSMLPPNHKASEYELDHIVPLCLGGSNDRSNLQLQTWDEAARKDKDEVALCALVHEGALTCDEAQQTMRDWR
jgi:hypothetical protein